MARRREEGGGREEGRGRRAAKQFSSESDEEPATVEDCIQDWIHAMRPLTQISYQKRLRPFLTWLQTTHSRDAFKCRRKYLMLYLNEVVKPRRLKSEHAIYTAISSFFKFLHSQRLIASDPTRSIARPKAPERCIPRRLSKEEVLRILEASKLDRHKKTRGMILCSLYGSLRISEVRSLKKSHLRKITAGLRPTYHLFVADGKGGRQRRCRLIGRIYRELEKLAKDHPTSPWMFPNARGDQISISAAHRRYKLVFEDAGLGQHGSHSLRHAVSCR